MSNMGTAIAQAVAASYDFSEFKPIVDVGGAKGSLISTILQANPALKGILFDLPQIVADVQSDARLQAIDGNFFESIPTGGDAYMMRWIIHDCEGLNIKGLFVVQQSC